MNKDKFVINRGTYLKPHYPYAVLFLESCTSVLVFQKTLFFSPFIPFVHPSWHSVTLGGGGIRDMQFGRRKVSTSSQWSLVQPFVSRKGEHEMFGRRGAAAPRLGAGLAAQPPAPGASCAGCHVLPRDPLLLESSPLFGRGFFFRPFWGPVPSFCRSPRHTGPLSPQGTLSTQQGAAGLPVCWGHWEHWEGTHLSHPGAGAR